MSTNGDEVHAAEAAAEGQGDEQCETEAPEGQEVPEERAEEDLPAGDEAPEGDESWGDQVDQEEAMQQDGEGQGEGEENAEGAEGDEHDAPEGGQGDEEYEVVDELDEDMDDHLEEMEREMGDDKEKKDEEKEGEKTEKKEERKFSKTRNPFFIPTSYEYKNDLRKMMMASTVLMGPLSFNDLSDEKIVSYIHKTQKVAVKFGKKAPSEDFIGYLELVFFSEAEAAECTKDFEGHREGFHVQHTHKDNSSAEINTIRDQGDIFAGKSGDTTVVIPDIPSSAKQEEIAGQIPEAKNVVIPTSTHSSRQKRYAYIEMADAEAARDIVGKEYKIDGEEFKVWRLENIVSYNTILRQVMGLPINRMMNQLPLDAGQRTHLFKLSLAVTHYMRTDYLERKALDDLKNAADPLRRLLRMDSQRRANRTSSYRGGRYRPMSTRGGRGSSSYRTDNRYSSRGGTTNRSSWSDRSPRSAAPKRRYDDYQTGGAYADKRSRSDSYREDSYKSRDYSRDSYDSYDRRDARGGRDDMGDAETRQAVDLLMGLTSMLKGRSSGSSSSTANMVRDAVRPRSSSRGGSSTRGGSSSYRGSSSSYRGSGSSYRGSSSRGGGSSYRGSRGGSSRGSYSSSRY